MDQDDFLAALRLCLEEPWRNFTVYTIWAVAQELGEQRRTIKTTGRGVDHYRIAS